MPDSNVISPAEAARIFYQLTGQRRTAGGVLTAVQHFPHLIVRQPTKKTGIWKRAGIDRRRWIYHIKSRLALGYEPHKIFSLSQCHGEEE